MKLHRVEEGDRTNPNSSICKVSRFTRRPKEVNRVSETGVSRGSVHPPASKFPPKEKRQISDMTLVLRGRIDMKRP